MGRLADAGPPASTFRSKDEIAGMELDGLRHIDLHLGVGIGVG
jgi:hypothetical protein